MHASDAPTACENCAAPLHGRYCHACGQSAANPLRHVGHAIEEFFESFWHLDGRVFRTLRELFVPGRVACEYLAGHRARYIAPLRLFIVLTVLTFFIGRVAMPDHAPAPTAGQAPLQSIEQARTVAEVERALAAELADIRNAHAKLGAVPGVGATLATAEDDLRRQAAARIAAIGGTTAAPAPARSRAGDDIPMFAKKYIGSLRDPDRPWHATDNPADVRWLPGFGDRWVNQRLANAQVNARRFDGDESLLFTSMLGAVPSALFVLVPVFALLLKLLYVRRGRGYLEHLVVSLYSHAFLLLALLGLFVLAPLIAAVTMPWLAWLPKLLWAAIWIYVPIYLLLMQKRVYGQHWPKTLLKYSLLGLVYCVLIILVLIFALFASMFGGA